MALVVTVLNSSGLKEKKTGSGKYKDYIKNSKSHTDAK